MLRAIRDVRRNRAKACGLGMNKGVILRHTSVTMVPFIIHEALLVRKYIRRDGAAQARPKSQHTCLVIDVKR